MEEIYYHYTGASGFSGILCDGFLKARLEWRQLELLDCRHAIHNLRSMVPSLCPDTLWRSLEEGLLRAPRHVVSFSRSGNAPDLWSRYGGDGTGVCIAFEKNRLDRSLSKGWERVECIYDEDERRRALEDLIKKLGSPGSLPIEERMLEIRRWSLQFKHRRFKAEREVRYFYSGGRQPETSSHSVPFPITGAVSEVVLGYRFNRMSRGQGAERSAVGECVAAGI